MIDNLPFDIIDTVIIIAVLISSFIGWVRGGTREILSLVSWCGGIYLAFLVFPYAKDITRQYVSHGLIADFLTISSLFVLLLMLLSLINYFISNLVKQSALSVVDKGFGIIFGIARGLAILAVLHICIIQYIFQSSKQFAENSKLLPTINSISNWIIIMLPEEWQDAILSHMSQTQRISIGKFINDKVIENIAPNSVSNIIEETKKHNKAIAQLDESRILKDNNIDSFDIGNGISQIPKQEHQSAEELATLKTKKITINRDKNDAKKERADMDRFLDLYDNVN
ncbi:MAG: CvpA family protein [Alphaproteobacteria bacterium]|nr:CvpA family protein [Alphaproteobacteria bacterium]